MTLRLAALLVCVAIALSFELDGYPLLEPDEGRNAEIAREMADRNSYLLPRLNGLPYVDKPVLFFAATAAAMELLGPTELAARLPALLFTFGTIALVWWWARRQWGDRAGWIAAIVTGASPLTLGFARTVIFDSTLTFFVTAATIAFYESAVGRLDGATVSDSGAPQTAEPPNRRTAAAHRWSALAWICLALGVLTKGPVALALPLMICLPFMAWRRAWRPLVDIVGILLFVVIVMPWVQAVSHQVPGFLSYAIGTETAARLFTPALGRTGPWWYFIPILLAGALPWTAVVLGGLRELRGGAAGRVMVLLTLWILVPLLFFSLSQSKRPQYVLPLMPPFGFLVAWLWTSAARAADPPTRPPPLPGVVPGAASLAALGILLLGLHRTLPALFRGMTPGVAAAVPRVAILLGAIALVGAALSWAGRARIDLALGGLALPVLAIPFVSGPLLDAVGRDRSSAELATAIRAGNALPAEVVAAGTFPLSLPFYLRQTLILASDDARELTSNYLARNPDRWRRDPAGTLRPMSWWRDAALACETPRIFLVRRDDYHAREFLGGRMRLLGESRKQAAYGPCGRSDLARGE